MKTTSLVGPLAKYAAVALLALATGSSLQAQTTIASDNASNYSGGWTNESNGGTGFGNWTISSTSDGAATPPSYAGAFTGNASSAGITGMADPSFGLFANPSGTNATVTVSRSFSAPLEVGQTFSFKWATNWDSDGGNKGFNIFAGGTQIVNVNQGSFPGNITCNDQLAIDGDTGFGNSSMTWTFNRTSSTNLMVSATSRNGSDTVVFTTNVTISSAPTGFSWYATAMGSGDQRQPYFNDLFITAQAVAPTVSGSPYVVSTVGSSFTYQVSTTPAATSYNATGLPAGLSINSTTGLISGTPASTGSSSVSVTATNDAGTSAPLALTIAVGNFADAAANYGGNWTTGSNAGTGFGNWTITSEQGTGFAGTFLGNPANAEITGMGEPSFGLYANPTESGAFATAERALTTPLSQGQSLSFQWAINWDSGAGNSTAGNKGFSLSTASGETLVVNNSNSSNITIESKSNNSTVTTDLQYGSAAMLWTFTQTTNSSVTITATPRGAGSVYTTSLPTSGEITAIKFYASNMQNGDNAQPYFNNFLITGGAAPEPPAYDSWASSYTLDPAVTTGPTAGAPTADPDSDSFTNQQEYAFGTNPTQATAGLLTSSSDVNGLTVVFLTRLNLTYNVQTTDNLSTTAFSDNVAVTATVGTSSDQSGVPSGYTRKQFTITPTGSKNFYRVVASEQNPG